VHLIPTGDPRVLDAAWYRDRLWLSLNHACSPPGDTETRACIRLIQVATSPSPASILQDFDYGIIGHYLFYSALSMAGDGSLFVVFSYSSPNDFPSVAVTGQAVTESVNTIKEPSIVKSGLGFSPGGRWGDYFG